MKQRNRIPVVFFISVIVLLMVTLTGCGGQEPGVQDPQTVEKPEVINISYSIRPLNVHTIVAMEKEMFEQAFAEDGIEVKWHELEGPATTEALAAKSIDFAFSLNYMTAVISKANGNDIKVISSYTKFPKAIGLLAGKDTGITSVEDLKGKKVALKKGTMLQEMLMKALEEANLQAEDVEIVDMDSTNAANAILLKQVDATILPDPLMMKTLSSGEAILLRNAEGLISGQAVIAARSEFLQQYPEIAKNILEIQKNAWLWSTENSEEALQLAAEATSMDIKAVNALYPKFDFSLGIDQSNITKLKESADFLQTNHFIKEDIDTGSLIEELVDTSYLPE